MKKEVYSVNLTLDVDGIDGDWSWGSMLLFNSQEFESKEEAEKFFEAVEEFIEQRRESGL